MIRKTLAGLLVAALLGVTPQPALAYIGLCCGKCGGNMPYTLPGGGVPTTGEFRLMVTPVYMHMEGLGQGLEPLAGGSMNETSLLGAPAMGKAAAGKYISIPTGMDMEMVRLGVGYSLNARLFGAVMTMWTHKSMGMRMVMQSGAMNRTMSAMAMPAMTMDSTMSSEGFGDVMLAGKYLLYADDLLIPTRELSLYFRLALPSGSTDESNAKGPLPYAMQLGSGTVDPSFGLTYQASASPYWYGSDVIGTPRLYDNSDGYRLGDEFRYDLYLLYQLNYELVVETQLNGYWQGRIHGVMDAAASGVAGHAAMGDPSSPYSSPAWDPANYGGHGLWATLGIQWQPIPLWVLELQAGTPLYQYLNGVQLQKRLQITFTLYRELVMPWSIRYTPRDSTLKGLLGIP